MPSKEMFDTPAYARAIASAYVGPRPTTVSTRPPAVTTSSPRMAVPAWRAAHRAPPLLGPDRGSVLPSDRRTGSPAMRAPRPHVAQDETRSAAGPGPRRQRRRAGARDHPQSLE